jgi:hypothetical protein
MSTQFFNGKANPFELPPLKIATSVRELEKAYPGPKVVIATDGALACGLAKELLLRWGGNPLCRVRASLPSSLLPFSLSFFLFIVACHESNRRLPLP